MIVPKKNTLRSITEKAEYLQRLYALKIITMIEFSSAIEKLRIQLKLDPIKPLQFVNERIDPNDFEPKNLFSANIPNKAHNGGEAGIV